jgi:hypothetical protein
MKKYATEYASIAKSLGVSDIPEGGFAFLRDAERATESLDFLNDWLSDAGLGAWSEFMDGSDAKVLAGQVRDIGLGVVKEQAKKLIEKGELVAGAIGGAVVAAIPIINIAVAAATAIFAAIKFGAKALDYQTELMRENRRLALMVQQVGFGSGELHKALPLPKGTDLFSRRSMVWLPAPAYLDNGLGFEITPAFYPAWNPYFAPGPYVPDKQVAKRSKINDQLLGWQQNVWSDPTTIMQIDEKTFRAMLARVEGLKPGMTFSWEGKGGSRVVKADEVALIRKCMGNVVAARAALIADPIAARSIALRRYNSAASGTGVEWVSGVADDFKAAITAAGGGPEAGLGSANGMGVNLGSLLEVVPPGSASDSSGGGSGGLLLLALAAGGIGVLALSRKK